MRDGFRALRVEAGDPWQDSRAARFHQGRVLRQWGKAGGRDTQKALCVGSGTDGLWEDSPR